MNNMSLLPKQKLQSILPHIPDDILHYNILTRLPVKSLVRFKSICKYWYTLINSSTFNTTRQNYYGIKSSHDDDASDLLIVSDNFFTYVDAPPSLRATHVTFDDKFSIGCRTEIVGLCNGFIICLTEHYDTIVLCNPLTREYRLLSIPLDQNNTLLDYYHLRRVEFGFGYDFISRDYKIVFISVFDTLGGHIKFVIHVYSTTTNSWKLLDEEVHPSINLVSGFYTQVNNVLHWFGSMTDDYYYPRNILTFDLHTEKFGCMTLPRNLDVIDDYWNRHCLMTSSGRLCILTSNFARYPSPVPPSIWVMKEYGVTKSWTKLYNHAEEISRFTILALRSSNEGEEALLVRSSDEESDELITWYNLDDKSFRKVDVPRNRKYKEKHLLCTPSLAPIPGDYNSRNKCRIEMMVMKPQWLVQEVLKAIKIRIRHIECPFTSAEREWMAQCQLC